MPLARALAENLGPPLVRLGVFDAHNAVLLRRGQAWTFACGVLGIVESLRGVVGRADRDRSSLLDQRHTRRPAVGQQTTTGLSDAAQRPLQVGVLTEDRPPERGQHQQNLNGRSRPTLLASQVSGEASRTDPVEFKARWRTSRSTLQRPTRQQAQNYYR